MKKSILTFVLFTVLGTSASIAQGQENVKFAICGSVETNVSHSDISKCTLVMPLGKNLIINSFTLSILDANSHSTDFPCIGNQVSAAALEALSKAPVGTKFLIGNIKASDGKTESKYDGFEMHIK